MKKREEMKTSAGQQDTGSENSTEHTPCVPAGGLRYSAVLHLCNLVCYYAPREKVAEGMKVGWPPP